MADFTSHRNHQSTHCARAKRTGGSLDNFISRIDIPIIKMGLSWDRVILIMGIHLFWKSVHLYWGGVVLLLCQAKFVASDICQK